MNAKWRIVAGSLAGALAIHAVLAACGGHGGMTSSQDGGVLDALIDALHGPDARAGTDAGSGASTCAAWQISAQSAGASPALQSVSGEPFAATFNPNLNEYVVWVRSCQ
jgi:hypothetical protein